MNTLMYNMCLNSENCGTKRKKRHTLDKRIASEFKQSPVTKKSIKEPMRFQEKGSKVTLIKDNISFIVLLFS